MQDNLHLVHVIWSMQDNLHLVHVILEGLEDGTKATLINLDQSKALDRVDHQFSGDCFGDCWIQTGVLRMD